MAEGVHGVRPVAGELVAWRSAAYVAGLPLNTWVRRALNERACLDAAIRRQVSAESNQGAGREIPLVRPVVPVVASGFAFRPDPKRK